MPARPKVLFLPGPAAWGPFNALRAFAEVCRDRECDPVFAVDASFTGKASQHGFSEVVYRASPPPPPGEDVDGMWARWVRDNAVHFSSSTREQLSTVIRPQWQELLASARYDNQQLVELIDASAPDLVVIDNVAADPAVVASGRPWVRSVSANPLELPGGSVPPAFSGLSVHDPGAWDDFAKHYAELHAGLHAEYSAFCVASGAPALDAMRFQYDSPWLTMYTYHEALDYDRPVEFRTRYQRLNPVVRRGEREWRADDHIHGDGPLLYVSLGSVGSMDLPLLQRLVDAVTTTGHRAVVSTGPFGDDLRLGSRMVGESFLPQPVVLPQCDLILTHGGSNTVNEALAAGLPMIVMPLFWDQYDNAQRVEDVGLGLRLDPYRIDAEELSSAVDGLLADTTVRERARAAAASAQGAPGRAEGGELIANLAHDVAT